MTAPIAISFAAWDPVPGVVLEGAELAERQLQFHDRKFWGVKGTSRIFGEYAHREMVWPVLIYDPSESSPLFDTARKLSDYIEATLGNLQVGDNGDLIVVSESFRGDTDISGGDFDGYGKYPDSTFEGARIFEGPKRDEAGTLGGGYWAIVMMKFTQLS
jgi:hypothetical protein